MFGRLGGGKKGWVVGRRWSDRVGWGGVGRGKC